MTDGVIGLLCILGSILLIQTGMHIAVSLMVLSFIGVWIVRGERVAGNLLARSAYDSMALDALGVIPLFVLMGLLVAASGIGRDTFDVASRLLRRVRGGLGMATVAANAVFAACTGTSIASASVFTRISVPEMIRYGYQPRFAVGVVAGSSVLGMLIPPSLLFIIYGVIANASIGHLFIAGIMPGVLLSAAFMLVIWLMAKFNEQSVFVGSYAKAKELEATQTLAMEGSMLAKIVPVVVIIAIVLGGIYAGFFSPNEAGAVGALAAFIIGLIRKVFTPKGLLDVALETGRVTAAILFLLMSAQMYSQMLTATGLPQEFAGWVENANLSYPVLIIGYLAILVILGTFLDSLSIILIVVPFALEIIPRAEIIWFGVITVIGVEIGLLTPPLGIACFVIHANLDRRDITIWDIFRGAMPFTGTMLVVLALIAIFPWLAVGLIR